MPEEMTEGRRKAIERVREMHECYRRNTVKVVAYKRQYVEKMRVELARRERLLKRYERGLSDDKTYEEWVVAWNVERDAREAEMAAEYAKVEGIDEPVEWEEG